MSVLGRSQLSSNQRLDLWNVLSSESFTAFDFRALVSGFSGIDNAYVLRGLEVNGRSGLTINVEMSDALLYNPSDNNGSFYYGKVTDADQIVTLPASQTNIFVEGRFSNTTGTPVNAGIWDPLALTGEDSSGSEYSTAVDSENYIVLTITVNTVGFTDGSIPILRASTSASAVTSMTDCRPLFFRLGTGGTTPDSLAKFPWATVRGEPTPAGTGVSDAVDSPWRNRDATGIINDKGIKNQKEWMDAVMTRISEITGSSLWYQSGSAVAPALNVSLNQIFFDTLGHSLEASKTATFKFNAQSGSLALKSEGLVAGSAPWTEGLIKWKANYSPIEWHLGGTFLSGTNRRYSTTRFISPLMADGDNLYLRLERETNKGSGNNVKWGDNSSYGTYPANQAVSGNPGDFTGIAIGDFIRKESEGYTRYYKVEEFSNGASSIATYGEIAGGPQIALKLSTVIAAPSEEPLIYFRARYQEGDLFVAQSGVVTDANFYWLGRRVGRQFMLKGYGSLQEGEEITLISSTWSKGNQGVDSALVLAHVNNASYTTGTGYKLKSGSGPALVIYKRARDNTVAPLLGDNSDAVLSYILDPGAGIIIPSNSSIWVRLSDTTSGTLSLGAVTNTTDDQNNTDVTTNVYEIKATSDAPLRTFDNKDVYKLATVRSVNGKQVMVFADGSMLDAFGIYTSNASSVEALKIDTAGVESVLFIDSANAGVVTYDPINFKYNAGTNLFTVQGFTFTSGIIDVATPRDVTFLPNLGVHTLTVGGPTSTIYIPGDIIVAGGGSSIITDQLLTRDKVIALGVGNPLNGGFGSGIEVADDTRTATSYATTNGSRIVTYTFAAALAPNYGTGDTIGVSATQDIGGITAGDQSGEYTIVAGTPSANGEAQVLTGPNRLLIYANFAATSTETDTVSPPQIFEAQWSFRVTDAAGAFTGITSWGFRVKGVNPVTVTPVTGYGIIPTANTTTFSSTRIPYAANDNAGPAGVDSTFDFDSTFNYNAGTYTLNVTNLNVTGTATIPAAAAKYPVSSIKTANYTVLATDTVIPVNTTAAVANVTILLPDATLAGTLGKLVIIKDVAGFGDAFNKTIVIDGNGTDTIDGDLTLSFSAPYQSISVVCYASGLWMVI